MKIAYYIKDNFKGVTPQYVAQSSTIVLNQKCIRNSLIDIAEAQYISDNQTFSQKKYLKEGDILICSTGKGTAGRCAYVSKLPNTCKVTIDSHILVCRCDDKIIAAGLAYVIFNLESLVMTFLTGSSGQAELDKGRLFSIDITLPETSKLESAINFLQKIDTKVSLSSQITREIEAFMVELYNYWFIQFDYPDVNGKPYKASGGRMVYSKRIKREIPAGWDIVPLGTLFMSARGISYSTETTQDGGVPMINLASFGTDGSYKPQGIKAYSGAYSKDKVIAPYALVMCNTQQTAIDFTKDIIGKAFLFPDIFEGDIVSSHHVTQIKAEFTPMKFYLHRLFNTDHFHKYIAGFTNGTNILGLIFEGVENYLAEIPDRALLMKYAELALVIEKKKSLIVKENQELFAMRDELLPMLMNGQVEITC